MPFMRQTYRNAFGRPSWYWRAYANRWKRRHAGGVGVGVDGQLDFSDADNSGLIALFEDI